MSAGHALTFEGMTGDTRRRLIAVTAINAAMFLIETGAGRAAGSQALQADALDFLASAASYALSLWAIGQPLKLRMGAAVVKGACLVAMGLWVAVTTLYQFFQHAVPAPEIMGSIGLVALAANGLSVWLLLAKKDSDANIRTVWLGSRNDAIGNAVVIVTAGLVGLLNSGAPDLIVAGVMAALFLSTAYPVVMQSWQEWRTREEAPLPDAHDDGQMHDNGQGPR